MKMKGIKNLVSEWVYSYFYCCLFCGTYQISEEGTVLSKLRGEKKLFSEYIEIDVLVDNMLAMIILYMAAAV